MTRRWSLAALLLTASFDAAFAQTLPPAAPGTPQPRVQPNGAATAAVLQADNDPAAASTAGPGAPLKNITLGGGGEVRLSVSAVGYVEAEYFKDEQFGGLPGDDAFWNTRLNVHADLNIGRRVRLHGALKHGGRRAYESRPAPPERDEADLHQAFLEFRFGDVLGRGVDDALLRAGRQELHYGAGRMISIRQGPNVRDDFDGLLVRARTSGMIVDAFAAYDVTDEPGAFDNETDRSSGIWGVYADLDLGGPRLDLYYLGDRRPRSAYVAGVLRERRHSVGARWWGSRIAGTGWSGDLEVTYQFGRSRSGARGFDVSAWSISGQASHSWVEADWQPSLGATFGLSSGDSDAGDGEVGTFRAPRPPGRYFGETTPFGPGNLAGGSIFLTVSPSTKLTIRSGLNLFWRMETGDGTYSPAGTIVRGAAGERHFAGSEANLEISYRVTSYITLTSQAGYFNPGGYLADNAPDERTVRLATGLQFAL